MCLLSTHGRNYRAVLACGMVVFALLAAFFAFSHQASAAPYNWSGGHDVVGWPEASCTLYFA
ncbi:MAG: hypothetical protein KKF66_07960, partial [Actinobacteria bacterium]|nr:hypothetical protein [Actinomycetota bacterium]